MSRYWVSKRKRKKIILIRRRKLPLLPSRVAALKRDPSTPLACMTWQLSSLILRLRRLMTFKRYRRPSSIKPNWRRLRAFMRKFYRKLPALMVCFPRCPSKLKSKKTRRLRKIRSWAKGKSKRKKSRRNLARLSTRKSTTAWSTTGATTRPMKVKCTQISSKSLVETDHCSTSLSNSIILCSTS